MRGLCFGGVREYDRLESSRARIIPRVVTMMAAVFVMVGIVIGGVLGVIAGVRVCPVWTSKVMRRL